MRSTCSEIMTRDPVVVSASDIVQKAAELMKQYDIGPLPVVDAETSRKLIGIITDRDIVINVLAQKKDPSKTKVSEVMSPDPVTCRESESINEALEKMSSYQIRRIPVVDDNTRIVGIIAQADIATRIENPEIAGEVVQEVSKE
ncbi:MAG TPA: CBS domain-containing protein [Acidobacteriota bacterium]|nr:CBS domain-containing protein [Acidobacteriota bacterium]